MFLELNLPSIHTLILFVFLVEILIFFILTTISYLFLSHNRVTTNKLGTIRFSLDTHHIPTQSVTLTREHEYSSNSFRLFTDCSFSFFSPKLSFCLFCIIHGHSILSIVHSFGWSACFECRHASHQT